jgi:hypothetical protein
MKALDPVKIIADCMTNAHAKSKVGPRKVLTEGPDSQIAKDPRRRRDRGILKAIRPLLGL